MKPILNVAQTIKQLIFPLNRVIGSIPRDGPIELFLINSQCSTTGVTKAVVCVILSVGWCI